MSERTKLYSAASIGSFDLTLILNGGDETRVRERCKFIKEDPNSQTLFNKSYGHKTEEASIYAQFHSLKQVPKPPISLDIEHFASGDFSYLGPFCEINLLWQLPDIGTTWGQSEVKVITATWLLKYS